MNVVQLENVSFSYDAGKTYVLRDFSLSIEEGAHIVLTGKNGAGKSTLAKIVAGLLAPDAGTVKLFGETCFSGGTVLAVGGTVPEPGTIPAEGGTVLPKAYIHARRKIAYVSQDPSVQLLCENVASDIAFPLQNLQFKVSDIDQAVLKQLEKAGLGDDASTDPKTLSGGQQQLVALASAIASEPELLVLDEPTSFLDEENTQKFLRLLQKTAGERTIFHVAHKVSDIDSADEVIQI